MSVPTLLDVAKLNGITDQLGMIDETVKVMPEINLVPSVPMKGMVVTSAVLVGLGLTTGSFRDANNGTDPIKPTYENRVVECKICTPRMEVDQAVAGAYDQGPQAFLAMQAKAALAGELQGICKQFYYGAGNNASGFPGLIQYYDATNKVVDAGGSTADTGSSIWLVKFGEGGMVWRWGQNGEFKIKPWREESITGTNGKKLDGWVSGMLAYPALQMTTQLNVVRIKKLTADSGKGATDALINTALTKFQNGQSPDVIFMNLRSLGQLQASRTATSPTGSPAPFPTSFQGVAGQNIPIAVTDAISSTESLTL